MTNPNVGDTRKLSEFGEEYKLETLSQNIESILEAFILEDKEDVNAILYSSFDDYIKEVWVSWYVAPYLLYASYVFIGYLNP